MSTALEEFSVPDDVSHVEIACVNFDQWILTVAVRNYDLNDKVSAMTHVVFEQVEGFRVLDEGAMLMFPWSELTTSSSFVHKVSSGGWYSMEVNSGNMLLPDGACEYLVATDNECVSIIAYERPRRVHS